jgi:ubiquinone/menaquinone biosynthesis C-methylase UbiE
MTDASLPEGEYFDRLVQEHGDFNPFADRGWQTLALRFASASHGARYARLLDIGCGTGQSRRIYADQARAYVGLDLSWGALRGARGRHPDGAWVQADGLRLPFGTGLFEAVAFSSVLHHVPDMPAALAEARRVLVPGGFVFAFDPNLLHPAMLLFRHPRSPLYSPVGVSPHERPLLPSALRRAFLDAGFTRVGQRGQSDIPYRHVGPRTLNAWLPAYNAFDRAWESSGLGRWFGTFVVTWGWVPS